MEAFGKDTMQQIHAELEDYCNLLAAQLPPRDAQSSPHRFSDGFFEELCRAAMAQRTNR